MVLLESEFEYVSDWQNISETTQAIGRSPVCSTIWTTTSSKTIQVSMVSKPLPSSMERSPRRSSGQ